MASGSAFPPTAPRSLAHSLTQTPQGQPAGPGVAAVGLSAGISGISQSRHGRFRPPDDPGRVMKRIYDNLPKAPAVSAPELASVSSDPAKARAMSEVEKRLLVDFALYAAHVNQEKSKPGFQPDTYLLWAVGIVRDSLKAGSSVPWKQICELTNPGNAYLKTATKSVHQRSVKAVLTGTRGESTPTSEAIDANLRTGYHALDSAPCDELRGMPRVDKGKAPEVPMRPLRPLSEMRAPALESLGAAAGKGKGKALPLQRSCSDWVLGLTVPDASSVPHGLQRLLPASVQSFEGGAVPSQEGDSLLAGSQNTRESFERQTLVTKGQGKGKEKEQGRPLKRSRSEWDIGRAKSLPPPPAKWAKKPRLSTPAPTMPSANQYLPLGDDGSHVFTTATQNSIVLEEQTPHVPTAMTEEVPLRTGPPTDDVALAEKAPRRKEGRSLKDTSVDSAGRRKKSNLSGMRIKKTKTEAVAKGTSVTSPTDDTIKATEAPMAISTPILRTAMNSMAQDGANTDWLWCSRCIQAKQPCVMRRKGKKCERCYNENRSCNWEEENIEKEAKRTGRNKKGKAVMVAAEVEMAKYINMS